MDAIPTWAPPRRHPRYPRLDHDVSCDVAVVGAGITGLTAAWRLKRMGLRVTVLEMGSVGGGASGQSTGHLTAALDVEYSVLRRRFGDLDATEAAAKSVAAIDFIQDAVVRNRIACDFRRVNGWRFEGAAGGRGVVSRESEAARALGLPVELVDPGPLPFMGRSLRFPKQAMFNPVAYLFGLAELVEGGGTRIFEDTAVDVLVDGEPCVAVAGRFSVRARHIVQATSAPTGVPHPMRGRMPIRRSYVIAVRLAGPLPPDLYWDCETPYHYLRPAVAADGTPVFLVGGGDHPSRAPEDATARFDALEAFACQRFPVASIVGRWSGELVEPMDGLPFAGPRGEDRHIFAATGLAGTGMTLGTAAAIELADRILRPDASPSVFQPGRFQMTLAAGPDGEPERGSS